MKTWLPLPFQLHHPHPRHHILMPSLDLMRRARRVSGVMSAAKAEKAALFVESAKQARQRQRASAMTTLHAVAHEVRNPLSAALKAFSFAYAAVNKRRPLTTDEECKLVREDMKVMSGSLHFVNDLLRNVRCIMFFIFIF